MAHKSTLTRRSRRITNRILNYNIAYKNSQHHEKHKKKQTNNLSEGTIRTSTSVFSIFLNCANEVEDRILMGRLCPNRRGAAYWKSFVYVPSISWGGFRKEQFGAGAERTGWDMMVWWDMSQVIQSFKHNEKQFVLNSAIYRQPVQFPQNGCYMRHSFWLK